MLHSQAPQKSGTLLESLHLPTQSRRETEVIQNGRTKVEREISHTLQTLVKHRDIVVKPVHKIIGRLVTPDDLEIDFRSGKDLAHFIVKLAGDCATLLFLGIKETMRKIRESAFGCTQCIFRSFAL
jgi:hypothetical protein